MLVVSHNIGQMCSALFYAAIFSGVNTSNTQHFIKGRYIFQLFCANNIKCVWSELGYALRRVWVSEKPLSSNSFIKLVAS